MLNPTRALSATSDEEIKEVLASGYPNVPTMLTQDPPLQRRYRKFVDNAFSPASLKALEPFIEATAHDLIDAFIDRGSASSCRSSACRFLFVSSSISWGTVEDLHLFRRWTEAAIRNLSGQLDRDGLLQAARETVEFQHYFVERIEERRKAPQDDILSKVVNASLDDEQPLSHAEALSMLQQILVAGNETTSSSFTEGILLLIENPDQYALLKNDPSPQMISNLVEEVLRISSPSSNMFRRATEEVEWHGVTIPKDAILFARFASANQDGDQFPEP